MRGTISFIVTVLLWATGVASAGRLLAVVSDTHEQRAIELRRRGDELFIASNFEDALRLYRRALGYWEHPKLYFSAGLCHLQLREYQAAADSFSRALEFDDGLLASERTSARGYLERATAKLGTIEVRTTQGAEILVDGRRIELVEGQATVRVQPGEHIVLARKGVHEASTLVRLAAGDRTFASPEITKEVTHLRWSRWKPWAVVGTGMAVAALSVPLYAHMNDLGTRANGLAASCAHPCEADAMYDDLVERSHTFGRYGTMSLAAGSVIAVTGLVLVAANTMVSDRQPLPTLSATSRSFTVGLATSW